MKVGDLVKYAPRHEDWQDLIGIVVETSDERFYHGRSRILWSDAHVAAWDWIRELRIINESR